jgi:hypothetical protein
MQEKDLIRLKREARANKGLYVEPEAKLLFVVRIRGINDMHPKVRGMLHHSVAAEECRCSVRLSFAACLFFSGAHLLGSIVGTRTPHLSLAVTPCIG